MILKSTLLKFPENGMKQLIYVSEFASQTTEIQFFKKTKWFFSLDKQADIRNF